VAPPRLHPSRAGSLATTVAFYLLPPASPLFLAAWLVAQAWTLSWFGPMLAALHERAPAGARATVIGFGLMALNIVGVATGPWITGLIGDRAGLTAGLLTSVAVGAVGLAVIGLVAWRRG
jgi:MFS family permease